MKKIELNKVTCSISEDYIITIDVKDNVEIEQEDIFAIRQANLELSKGLQYVVLVLVGQFAVISKEAREVTATKEFGETRKAMAFVISSLPQRIVGNFFIKMNNPPTPTKIFNSKEEALNWLKTFQQH